MNRCFHFAAVQVKPEPIAWHALCSNKYEPQSSLAEGHSSRSVVSNQAKTSTQRSALISSSEWKSTTKLWPKLTTNIREVTRIPRFWLGTLSHAKNKVPRTYAATLVLTRAGVIRGGLHVATLAVSTVLRPLGRQLSNAC
jgi:hypothetical protein